ncbi:protein prenyltransferase alpha subunit repeat-containing protein 1-like isoform X1 [Mytilus edulis]|uniref:protein prenyltransferase alpha subunit repeat-containing protein 1-like isoform X1 n=2 Tax=Mytilus edulis TaxID=6550 RepID=UPI0039EFA3E1
MSSDSRGCRLLSDLNSVFRKDPEIDEYDFLPVLEPKHNRSPLILQDHKLGLEMWSVKILHHYAYNTLMTWRMKEVNAKFLGQLDLINLTRAIVLVNPDCSTAWNIRKELIENGDLSVADDLKLGALVLGKHPKSPETFSHRKWLFTTLVDSCLANSSGSTVSNSSVNMYNNFVNMDAIDVNLDPNVQNGFNVDPSLKQPDFQEHAFKELRNCQKASDKYPSNYNAWSHRIWVVKHCLNCSLQVLFGELHTTESWVSKHISDHSGFHYRQFLLTSLQKQSIDLKEQFSVCYKHLIQKELATTTDLIKCYEGHEALWYHRRYIFQNLCQSYSAGTLVELFHPQHEYEDDIVLNISQKKTKLENERQVLLLKEIDTVTKSDLISKDKFHKTLAQKYIDWIQKFSRSLES